MIDDQNYFFLTIKNLMQFNTGVVWHSQSMACWFGGIIHVRFCFREFICLYVFRDFNIFCIIGSGENHKRFPNIHFTKQMQCYKVIFVFCSRKEYIKAHYQWQPKSSESLQRFSMIPEKNLPSKFLKRLHDNVDQSDLMQFRGKGYTKYWLGSFFHCLLFFTIIFQLPEDTWILIYLLW